MGAPSQAVTETPTALTIAGSDSGGGAGIQADLKVFMALRCHGASAITALTAQNTVGVHGVWEVPAEFVVRQIEVVASDIEVSAVKTGMLSSAAIVEAVAGALHRIGIGGQGEVAGESGRVGGVMGIPLVVDPVFVSKHGSRLLAEDAVAALKQELFPRAALVTPNLHEVQGLLGTPARTVDEMKDAGRALLALGPTAVLVKGGHLDSPGEAIDVYVDDDGVVELTGPRYATTDTHGTGCTLAAASAARMAHGDSTINAARAAKEFVDGAIRHALRLGAGYGPVNPAWGSG
jgi:hydroxymethylpyrimidine/phosphomethylpyrimidine kinase